MASLKDLVVSAFVKKIESDPVYKDFYLMKAYKGNGDIVYSPIMDHSQYMIWCAGVRSLAYTGEFTGTNHLIGRGSEDDVTDLLYREQMMTQKELEIQIQEEQNKKKR